MTTTTTTPQSEDQATAGPPAPPPLGTGLRRTLAALGAASGALAGMAFVGMFSAVTKAVSPVVGKKIAWMVPVGTDLGIIILSGLAIWLELAQKGVPAGKRLKLWWLRGMILALIGLQLGINVGAAHGDPFGSAVHAVLPVLFVSILEVWQFIIRWRRGLVAERGPGQKRDKIPFARYLADYRGSREIRRHMILWGVTSYSAALDMLQKKRKAEAALAVMFPNGHDRPPQDLVFMLGTSKYLDDACAEIAKLRKNFDKGQNPRSAFEQKLDNIVNPGGDGPGGNGGDQAEGQNSECCAAHKALALRQVLPMEAPNGDGSADPIGNAVAVNESHIASHGSAIGADNLRQLFRIGTQNARKLRDDLKARRESGHRSGAESGAGSAPGRAAESGRESGQPSGASRDAESVGRVLTGVGAATGRADEGGEA
ncbi:MAG: hypothetical protein FWE35_01060 [Streptosporangiales bacterium]|nr:hypothetical protein [Streptosporangiales bacterium]